MKTKALIILILCFAGLLMLRDGSVAQAQGPTILGLGPDGGVINSLAIDPKIPTTLYATNLNRIYKSTDGGLNWILKATLATTNMSVSAIVVDPNDSNNLVAAIDDSNGSVIRIFSSKDGGSTWNQINTTNFIGFNLSFFAVDPTNFNNMLFGTFINGVYKSTDGGKNWVHSTSAPLSFSTVNGLAYVPNNPTNVFAVTPDAIFKSTNGGTTWSSSPSTGLPTNTFWQFIAIDPINSDNMFLVTASAVYKSTNSGTSWTPSNSGLTADDFLKAITIDPVNPSTIYLASDRNGASDGRIYKTTNGGNSWAQVISGLPHAYMSEIVVDPTNTNTVFASGGAGVFKTIDAASNWVSSSKGINAQGIKAISIDPANHSSIYIGTTFSEGFRTVDSGTNWDRMNLGAGSGSVMSLAIDPTNTAITYAVTSAGLFKSTDHGQHWSDINSGFTGTFPLVLILDPTNPSRLFVGATNGVYRSTDSGNTWMSVNQGLTTSLTRISSLAIDPFSPSTVYAATTSNGIYKSNNGGDSWNLIGSNGSDGKQVVADFHTPGTIYVVGDDVLKSTDGGITFKNAGAGIPLLAAQFTTAQCLALDPVFTNVLYAGAFDGLYKSYNGGFSWAKIASVSSGIQALAVDPSSSNLIYAGTSREGVLQITAPADVTPPTVTVTYPPNGQATSSHSIPILGVVTDDKNSDGIASLSINGVPQPFDHTTGAFLTVLTLSGEGSFPVTILATDVAGNVSNPVVTTITVDTTAPTISISSPGDGQTINGPVTVTGSVNDNGSGIATVEVNHVQATITANTFTAVVNNPCNSGPVTLTAVVADRAGNSASASRQITVSGATATSPCISQIGPSRGDMAAVAISASNPNKLYALDNHGRAFKSVDAGSTWQESDTGLPPASSISSQSLAVDPSNPDTVYVTNTSSGVYKTVDGGLTWISANTGLISPAVRGIAINKSTGSLFAGTGNGLYKSIDGGAHWQLSSNGLPNIVLVSIAPDPNNPLTLYAIDGLGTFAKSTNDGQSWTTSNGNFGTGNTEFIAVNPSASNLLYTAVSGELYLSSDSGSTWAPAGNNVPANPITAVLVDPLHGNTVFAASNKTGMYKSTTGGSNLSQTNNGLASLLIRGAAIDPINTLNIYAATASGIAKSTDGGLTWKESSDGINSLAVFGLSKATALSNTVYAATAQGVARSSNGGFSWDFINSGLPAGSVSAVAVAPSDPQVVYAATDVGVFRSDNAGLLWAGTNSFSGTNQPEGAGTLAVDPTNPSILYAAGGGGCFKTTNGGATWTNLPGGPFAPFVLMFSPSDVHTLYGGNNTGLFKTVDGGSTWIRLSPQNSFLPVSSLALTPLQPNTIYYSTGFSTIQKSVDGGLTWKSTTTVGNAQSVFSLAIDSQKPNTLYASSADPTVVYVSNNGGTDWAVLTDSTTGTRVNAMLQDPVYPGTLYLATNTRGVLVAQSAPDLTGPTITINSPTSNSSTNGTVIGVTATVTDAESGVASVTINGVPGIYDSNTNRYTAAVPAPNEGTIPITVTAADNAGNTSTPATVQVIVDRTSPSVTVDSPVEGGTTGRTVTVTGTVSDSGSGVFGVFVNGFSATLNANSYSVTLPLQCNRPMIVTAVASDKAFNTAVVTRHVTVADPNPLTCWDNPGPEGGIINDVATDPANPGVVFAASAGQVYRSADAGTTWIPAVNNSLGGTIVSLLAPANAPHRVYFSGTAGIYKSANSGLDWNPSYGGLPFTTGTISADPSNTSVLFVVSSSGIFKSTDGGAGWILSNSGIVGTPRIVTVDPATSSTIYAGTTTSLFKSTNGGVTWQLSNIGLPSSVSVNSIIVAANDSNTLYAGTSSGVYKTTNAGGNWVKVSTGLPITNINIVRFDPAISSTIYAGTQTGLYRSLNSGVTWAAVGASLPSDLSINGIAFDTAISTMYVGTGAGVYKSFDGGANWTSINRGILANRALVTAVDPSDSKTIYAMALGSLYKSTDGGATWIYLSSSLSSGGITQLVFDPFNSQNIFASSQSTSYKTNDGGVTWTPLAISSSSSSVITFDPLHQGTIYAGGFSLLSKSTDGGQTWTEVFRQFFGFGFPNVHFRSVGGIAFDPTKPNTIYVANGTFFSKSTNGGASWTDPFNGFGTFQCLIMDIVDPNTMYACNNGVVKTTDGGSNWTQMNTGLPSVVPVSLLQSPDNPSVIYAGLSGSRIAKTSDGAANWSLIDPLFIGFLGRGMSLDQNDLSTIYAGGISGVFILHQSADPNELVPAIAGLSQSVVPPSGPAFNLTIAGSNFVIGSKVLWNGSPRLTAFNSGTQVTASITAADIATPGMATITVINPGNHTSNSQTVQVGKTDQSIAFGVLPNRTFGGNPFTINATASSSLPVSFSVVSGPASVSGNTVTMLGAGTVVLEAHQDGNAAFNAAQPVDQSFVINNPLAQIFKLSPGAIIAGSGQTTVKILGGFYVTDTLVKVDGIDHAATYVNPIEMDMVLSPAEIATPSTKIIRVFNSAPGGGTSIPVTLKIISITSSDSKNIQPGATDTVSNAPTQSGDAGITAQLNHSQSAGGPATVTVQQYSADPLGGSGLIDVGGGYVDLKVTGSAPDDTLNATFYYGSNVIGTDESKLQLLYYTGTKWAKVRSSGNTDPVKNTSDNQDGTVSGGSFTVVFDETSSPKLSQLTGTIFSSTPGLYGDLNNDQVINVVDLILMANFLAGNTTVDKTAADLTLDNKVNVGDLFALANFLAGNVAHLPISSSP